MSGKPTGYIGWTATGNYPAGPNRWNGQPVAIAPTLTLFTPNQKPPAQWWNSLLGSLTAQDEALLDWTGSLPAVSWHASWVTTAINGGITYLGCLAACWDPFSQLWVVAMQQFSTAGIDVYTGLGMDGASYWTQLTSGLSDVVPGRCAIVADVSTRGKYWLAGDTGTAIKIWSLTSGVVTVAKTITYTSAPQSMAAALTSNGVGLGALHVGVSGLAAADSAVWTSTDGGATWSSFTAAFGSATIRMYLQTSGEATTPHTLALAQNAGSQSGYGYFTLAGGWQSLSSAWIPAGYRVNGLAWGADAAGPCWIALLQNTGTNVTLIYRSSDGITWSLQPGRPLNFVGATSLAAQGSLLVVALSDGGTGGPSGQWMSPDGGVTWYLGVAGFDSSVANSGGGAQYYIEPRIIGREDVNNGAGGATSFFHFNNIRGRFSSGCGLPGNTA